MAIYVRSDIRNSIDIDFMIRMVTKLHAYAELENSWNVNLFILNKKKIKAIHKGQLETPLCEEV